MEDCFCGLRGGDTAGGSPTLHCPSFSLSHCVPALPPLTGSTRRVRGQEVSLAVAYGEAKVHSVLLAWPPLASLPSAPPARACGKHSSTLGTQPGCSEPGSTVSRRQHGIPLGACLRPAAHPCISVRPQEVKFEEHCLQHTKNGMMETLGKARDSSWLRLTRVSHIAAALTKVCSAELCSLPGMSQLTLHRTGNPE